MARLGRMFSLRSRTENKKTIIGVVVMITVLLMGVEYSNPLKNANILIAIPRIAARRKAMRSALSIGCLGINNPSSQKRMVAPMSRIPIKPNPCT